MNKPTRRTKDGLAILHKRFYHGKPRRVAALEEARAADEVARKLAQLRADAAKAPQRAWPG